MVACPTCGKELAYIAQYDRYYCYEEGTYAPKGFAASEAPAIQLSATGSETHVGHHHCPDCGKELAFIQQYDRWYCFAEGKYAPKDVRPVTATGPASETATVPRDVDPPAAVVEPAATEPTESPSPVVGESAPLPEEPRPAESETPASEPEAVLPRPEPEVLTPAEPAPAESSPIEPAPEAQKDETPAEEEIPSTPKEIRIAEAPVPTRVETKRSRKDRPRLRWGQIQKAKKGKLAEWAEAYGLDASGTRTELRDRLLKFIDEHRNEEGATEEVVEVESPPGAVEAVTTPIEEAPPIVEPAPEPTPEAEPAAEPEHVREPEPTPVAEPETAPESIRQPEPEVVVTPEPQRDAEPEPAAVSELPAAESMTPPMLQPATIEPPKEEPAPAPAAAPQIMEVARALPCPNCGKDLAYLAQYDRLYCFSCGRYAPKKYGKPEEVEAPKAVMPPPVEVRPEPVVLVAPKIEPPKPVEEPRVTEGPMPPEAKVTHPCPTCGNELRYVRTYDRWWCDADQKYAPKEYGRPKNACPTCGKDLTWIPTYGRWYCYAESRYAPKTMTAPSAATVVARAPAGPIGAPIARAPQMVVQAPAVSEDRVLALEGVKHVHGGAGAGVGLAVTGLILVLIPILLMDFLPVLGTVVVNIDPTTPDGLQNLIMLTLTRDIGIIVAIGGIVAGLVGLRRRRTP